MVPGLSNLDLCPTRLSKERNLEVHSSGSRPRFGLLCLEWVTKALKLSFVQGGVLKRTLGGGAEPWKTQNLRRGKLEGFVRR
jgi:hypothetical protein